MSIAAGSAEVSRKPWMPCGPGPGDPSGARRRRRSRWAAPRPWEGGPPPL